MLEGKLSRMTAVLGLFPVFGQTVVPAGVKTQVIIHKTYTTPVSDGCTLKQQLHTVLVTNVVNPQLLPDGSVDLTLWLEPGGEGRITLRVIDPDPTDDVTFNPVSADTPVSPTVTSSPCTAPATASVRTPSSGSTSSGSRACRTAMPSRRWAFHRSPTDRPSSIRA